MNTQVNIVSRHLSALLDQELIFTRRTETGDRQFYRHVVRGERGEYVLTSTTGHKTAIVSDELVNVISAV